MPYVLIAGHGSKYAAVSSPSDYTTGFDSTETPISESGRWSRAANSWTNVVTANGRANGTNGALDKYDDSYSLLTGFGADYEMQATVFLDGSNINRSVANEIFFLFRGTDSATQAFGYECNYSFDGVLNLIQWNGGPFNDFSMYSFPSVSGAQSIGREFVTGDVIKARIVGGSVTMYVNGTSLLTSTVSAFASGSPGIGAFTRPGGNSAYYSISDLTVTPL